MPSIASDGARPPPPPRAASAGRSLIDRLAGLVGAVRGDQPVRARQAADMAGGDMVLAGFHGLRSLAPRSLTAGHPSITHRAPRGHARRGHSMESAKPDAAPRRSSPGPDRPAARSASTPASSPGASSGLWAFYWHFIRQGRWLVVALFIFGGLIAMLDVTIPAFIGRVVGLVSTHAPADFLRDIPRPSWALDLGRPRCGT